MKQMIFFISFLFCLVTVNVDSGWAQSKGKLEGFEESMKGKDKDKKNKDDEEEEDSSWGSFIFELIFNLVISDSDDDYDSYYDDDDEYYYDDEDSSEYADWDNDEFYMEPELANLFWNESENTGYSSFPFEDGTGITMEGSDKSFLGRLSGGYLPAGSNLYAWNFDISAQFWYGHGIELEYIDFREEGRNYIDHLRVFSLDYRYLIPFSNELDFTLIGGFKGYRGNDTEYGLDLGIEMQWFFFNNLSFTGKAVVTPFFMETVNDETPSLTDLGAYFGLHYKNIELTGGYRALIPPSSNATLDAPVLGVKIWF